MRANVINVSNPNVALSMVLGGSGNDSVKNYISSKYESFASTIHDMGSAFGNTIKSTYNYYTNNNMLNDIKQSLTMANAITRDDSIYELSMENFNSAGMVMRRYAMSEPSVYKKYINNRLSGWDDMFADSDRERSQTPDMRTDYLHAIDGIIRFGETEEDNVTTFTMVDGIENPLSIEDRWAINNSWDNMKLAIADGYDPTDLEETYD